MHLKKFLLFGLIAAVLPAVAEEAADRKTATSLKYVEHELSTRQNKFGVDTNKAMEYTNSAGDVQKRAVTSDLGSSTTDTSLPMVGGVNTKLNQKQDDIDPVNDHTAVTYTGQPGGIGQKGIYQTTESYVEQSDNLIDAKTFNAALKNGLDSEFRCSDNRQPDTNECWLWEIHSNDFEYVSATGIVVQNGSPTPEHPIYPIFYHLGNMILRRVGDYADSYDATTHKITRRVGVAVFDGTETWQSYSTPSAGYSYRHFINDASTLQDDYKPVISSHFEYMKWCWIQNENSISFDNLANNLLYTHYLPLSQSSNVMAFKQWLAAQYAAGTPVTVYYPLATPVEEDWTETTYNENVYIPQNQN